MSQFQIIVNASIALTTWFNDNVSKLTMTDVGLYHLAQAVFHIAAQLAVANDKESMNVSGLPTTSDAPTPGPVSELPGPGGSEPPEAV
jgi:hypothetical protein